MSQIAINNIELFVTLVILVIAVACTVLYTVELWRFMRNPPGSAKFSRPKFAKDDKPQQCQPQ